MAESQFYASVYAGSLQMDFDSHETTKAFRESMKSALPEFYAAVLVFSTKAARYYRKSLGLGELLSAPHDDRLCLRRVLTLHLAVFKIYLKPFSITFGPCLKEIDEKMRELKCLASAATMERIKGKPYELLFSAGGLIYWNRELRKTSDDPRAPHRAEE